MAGTAARYAMTLLVPARDGWPVATLSVNLVGAFVLGLLLEALARRGPDRGTRRRADSSSAPASAAPSPPTARWPSTSICCCATGQAATAVAYGLTTVVVGFLVCTLGIWIGARRGPRAAA